eukprot:1558256-Prymnesium_polylepis.1
MVCTVLSRRAKKVQLDQALRHKGDGMVGRVGGRGGRRRRLCGRSPVDGAPGVDSGAGRGRSP